MALRCEKCGFKFSQSKSVVFRPWPEYFHLICGSCWTTAFWLAAESSLVRHSKICSDRAHKARSARQKSCRECSAAKTRCDLRRPICSRCSMRDTSCQYAVSVDGSEFEDVSHAHRVGPTIEKQKLGGMSIQTAILPEQIPRVVSPGLSSLHLSDQHTFLESSLINFEDLDANLVLTGALDLVDHPHTLAHQLPPTTTPKLVHHSMELILRILRTWPRTLAKEISLPPMIHPSQLSEQSQTGTLSNCITLVKMWYGQCPGATEIVQDTVKREMQELINNVR